MEMRGIEPRASHMLSERSTTELHPHRCTGMDNQRSRRSDLIQFGLSALEGQTTCPFTDLYVTLVAWPSGLRRWF